MIPLAYLRRYGRVILEVAGIVVFLTCLHVARVAGARAGVAEADVARLTREKRVLAMESEVARVQYVTIRDTVRVRATRWDTLRVEARITDTVWVRAALASADTVIHACRLALNRCDTLHRLDSLTIANRDSLVTATRALIPGRMARAGSALKWALVGAATFAVIQQARR